MFDGTIHYFYKISIAKLRNGKSPHDFVRYIDNNK